MGLKRPRHCRFSADATGRIEILGKLNFQKSYKSYPAMRHLFFILMIALLPLRGWVSDAMATSMVTAHVQQQSVAITPAAHAHEAGMQAHQDSPTLVADVSEASETVSDCASHAFGEDEHAADTHCNTCSACQACHTVALSTSTGELITTFNPRTLPRAAVTQFVSAERALDQKPPIS